MKVWCLTRADGILGYRCVIGGVDEAIASLENSPGDSLSIIEVTDAEWDLILVMGEPSRSTPGFSLGGDWDNLQWYWVR